MKKVIRLLAIGNVVVFLLAIVSRTRDTKSMDAKQTFPWDIHCIDSAKCIRQYIAAGAIGAVVGFFAFLLSLYLQKGLNQEVGPGTRNQTIATSGSIV